MALELKIFSPEEDGFIKAIEWNHEEIKAEVRKIMADYKGLTYTDEQIPEAKKDRATLRKFIDALENKRKEVKAACLAPYQAFEAQIKEITAIVNGPVALIDRQIKDFEDHEKEEKRNQIIAIFADSAAPDWLNLGQVWNDKWLNKGYHLDTIREEIGQRIVQIDKDIMTLEKLPEFAFEAIDDYRRTLDLAGAIAEGQRLAEIQKRKARAEEDARAAMEAKARADEEAAKALEEPAAEDMAGKWVRFEAYLTTETAKRFGDFLRQNDIKIRKI